MTTTAPVTFGLAGMGGGESVGFGGLGGLFASLLGHAGMSDGVMPSEGITMRVVGGEVADGLALDGLMPNVFQFEDGSVVEVQGEGAAVTAFLQQVQVIYQKVVVEGGVPLKDLSDTGALAAALTKLGMDPELAQLTAERIETMMELVEQAQGQALDEEQEGGLVALMLAAMLGQQKAQSQGQVQSFRLEIVTVEQTSVTVNVLQSFQKTAGPADLLREMVGDTMPVKVEGEGADVAAEANKGEPKREVVFHVSVKDGVPVISVNIPPQDKVMPLAETAAQVASQVAEVASTPVVEKVSVDKILEKPKGEVVYQWQSENGVETLQSVKPVAEGDLLQNSMAGAQGARQGYEAATPAEVDAQGFAERVALARHHAVAAQVAVQIQPLAEQGGGTVRMTLNPAELGQVQVELSVRDGQVHGAISASDPVVVEQLARELHSLRHGLAEAGLKLGEQGINLMLSNHNGGNQGQGGNGHAQGWSAGSDVEAQVELAADWVAPERLVDVKI